MAWVVLIGGEFEPEFLPLPKDVQDETLAMTLLLQRFGPIWDVRTSTRLRIRVMRT
jgi:hypothetical protein